MNRALAIRRAEPEDAEGITRLCATLGYPTDAAAVTKRLVKMTQWPTHAVFVACDEDGAVHGFIAAEQRLLIEAGDRVEIVALSVDETARRGGTGRALVTAAELWAHKRGVSQLMVRSNVLREDAHAFYAGIGYQQTKSQHVYLRDLRAD